MGVLLSRTLPLQCRWPVCEAVEPPSLRGDTFGRARVCGAIVSFPTSYCAEHRLRVYEGAPAMRPPADLSSARQAPAPDFATELTEIFG